MSRNSTFRSSTFVDPKAKGVLDTARTVNDNIDSLNKGQGLLKGLGIKVTPELISMMKGMELIEDKKAAQVKPVERTVAQDVNQAVNEIIFSGNQPDPGFPPEKRGGEMPTVGNILAEARGKATQNVIRRMNGVSTSTNEPRVNAVLSTCKKNG